MICLPCAAENSRAIESQQRSSHRDPLRPDRPGVGGVVCQESSQHSFEDLHDRGPDQAMMQDEPDDSAVSGIDDVGKACLPCQGREKSDYPAPRIVSFLELGRLNGITHGNLLWLISPSLFKILVLLFTFEDDKSSATSSLARQFFSWSCQAVSQGSIRDRRYSLVAIIHEISSYARKKLINVDVPYAGDDLGAQAFDHTLQGRPLLIDGPHGCRLIVLQPGERRI